MLSVRVLFAAIFITIPFAHTYVYADESAVKSSAVESYQFATGITAPLKIGDGAIRAGEEGIAAEGFIVLSGKESKSSWSDTPTISRTRLQLKTDMYTSPVETNEVEARDTLIPTGHFELRGDWAHFFAYEAKPYQVALFAKVFLNNEISLYQQYVGGIAGGAEYERRSESSDKDFYEIVRASIEGRAGLYNPISQEEENTDRTVIPFSLVRVAGEYRVCPRIVSSAGIYYCFNPALSAFGGLLMGGLQAGVGQEIEWHYAVDEEARDTKTNVAKTRSPSRVYLRANVQGGLQRDIDATHGAGRVDVTVGVSTR